MAEDTVRKKTKKRVVKKVAKKTTKKVTKKVVRKVTKKVAVKKRTPKPTTVKRKAPPVDEYEEYEYQEQGSSRTVLYVGGGVALVLLFISAVLGLTSGGAIEVGTVVAERAANASPEERAAIESAGVGDSAKAERSRVLIPTVTDETDASAPEPEVEVSSSTDSTATTTDETATSTEAVAETVEETDSEETASTTPEI